MGTLSGSYPVILPKHLEIIKNIKLQKIMTSVNWIKNKEQDICIADNRNAIGKIETNVESIKETLRDGFKEMKQEIRNIRRN